jgi:hypothetical protein
MTRDMPELLRGAGQRLLQAASAWRAGWLARGSGAVGRAAALPVSAEEEAAMLAVLNPI